MRDYLRLYVDDSRVGCGWHAFVLVARGRKWARLVEPVQGVRLKLPVEQLCEAKPIERVRWPRIARQLRRSAHGDRGLKRLAAELRRAA